MPESDVEAQDRVKAVFGICPCLWQIKVVRAILSGKDVVTIAPTGSGKSLTYWMSLIFVKKGIIIMVAPLKQLASQFEKYLIPKGFPAIAVTKKNTSDQVFQDIINCKYRVVLFSPETLVHNAHFEEILQHRTFMRRIINLVFDEAHCIKEWGCSFRDAYTQVGTFRRLMCRHIPINLGSATMSPSLTQELRNHMALGADVTIIRLDTDRKNIFLRVTRMQHPANSYLDLTAYISSHLPSEGPHMKFLIFFNSRAEAEDAAEVLRTLLGKQFQHRVKWVHAGMTEDFREDEIHALEVGDVDGECCTDVVGMGIDIRDLYLIIQYRAPKSLSTWWQRAGRAVRDLELNGTAVMLVEKEYFDEEKKRLAEEAVKKREAEAKEKEKVEAARLLAVTDAQAGESVPSEAVNANRKRPMQKKTSRRKSKKKKEDIPKAPVAAETDAFGYEIKVERAMDDFINAENRPAKCRRRVGQIHFGNINLEPISGPCCARCDPRPVVHCCDLCEPDYWPNPPIPALLKVPTKKRMANPKPYTRGPKEKALRDELDAKRKAWAREKLPEGSLLGPHAVMATSILERIVDLAHYSKLKSLPDFGVQVPWAYTDEYGPTIISIIQRHAFPPLKKTPASRPAPLPAASPFTTTPMGNRRALVLQPENVPSEETLSTPSRPSTSTSTLDPSQSVPAKRKNKPSTCSRCRQIGHRSMCSDFSFIMPNSLSFRNQYEMSSIWRGKCTVTQYASNRYIERRVNEARIICTGTLFCSHISAINLTSCSIM
ncbi:P-loop containing nucleoside triphosphate hydrolase protein [Hymenopellis radicata]|nr:P-loop containing nucleoside triphosphate hydrolase protein [Hymenopellis radicata]